MLLKEVLEVYELLDSSYVVGQDIKDYFDEIYRANCTVKTVAGNNGSTDFIKLEIPGSHGKKQGGSAPSLLIIGRLGGIGARPSITGFVSDGDGALAVLSLASKILKMKLRGDHLQGDIVITTHIAPHAPTIPHEPVSFMGSPVDMEIMNQNEVVGDFDAVLSVDTTKGNNIINYNGFSISPTIKSGYILKTSDDCLKIMERVTGKRPSAFAVAHQDLTPYGNGVHHLNSILQPSVITEKPVIGVAITSQSIVPGSATETTNPYVIEECSRFLLAVAKEYGMGKINFYDKIEYERLVELYGDLTRFQGKGV